MRSRILPVAGVSAAALACAMAFAPMASASSHGIGVAAKSSTSHSKVNPAKSCASQRDNDNGVGIVSQNFESAFDIYDAQGADDVKVKKCKLKKVTADGIYFNGSGPADSFNVTIYKNASGTPGAVKKACNNAAYTDSGFGSPIITCKGKIKGALWVSVQANMNFSTGGEWGWNTNNTVRGTASQWQNPGNGFSTGCTSYTTTTTCIPSGEGGDFSFSLN